MALKITIEGPAGSGKSTIAHLLRMTLVAAWWEDVTVVETERYGRRGATPAQLTAVVERMGQSGRFGPVEIHTAITRRGEG